MTYLITGGAGFIGSSIAKHLIERGDTVVCIDNFTDYYNPTLKRDRIAILKEHPKFFLYEQDITDEEGLKNIFQTHSINAICHEAAQAGVRHSKDHPYIHLQTNVQGVMSLLETAKEFDIKNIVLASSGSVYGEAPIFREDISCKPTSNYGATKKMAEILASTYHEMYGLPITILRYFNVYGPLGRPDAAYFIFTDCIAKQENIRMHNFGNMRRCMTYIDDIVRGTVHALDNPQNFEIYNLGNPTQISLNHLVELIEQNLGKKATRELVSKQPGEIDEVQIDISKATNQLSFIPTTDVEEGVQKFVEWYNEYTKHRIS